MLPDPTAAPKVSVVIITRNRPQMLADCLEHLSRQCYRDFETIVVDSSDNHDTEELLKSWPQVCGLRIWDGRNNMPQARNLGISHAQGEIVTFIDDDCLVFPEWLEKLIPEFEDSEVGGAGGFLIDERLRVQEGGKVGIVSPNGETIANFNLETAGKKEVDWLGGGNMAFRKQILERIGGFDSRFIGDNSYEEVDVACRVRKAGYKILWIPDAKVHHLRVVRVKGVVSRDSDASGYRFYQAHNLSYFVAKNLTDQKPFQKHAIRNLYGMAAYGLKKRSLTALKLIFPTASGYIYGKVDAALRARAKKSKQSGR